MVQALLGIRPFAPMNLLIIDPHLPDWLPEVRLSGLRVGDALVDLHEWREQHRTRWKSELRHG